jgi:hypothetical protein
MPDDEFVLKVFSSEIEAGMAQQILQEGGVRSFMFKDDAGGMEPHLQMTGGVRLLINRAEVERANRILKGLISK